MYPYVLSNLRRRFPKSEGWNVIPQPHKRTYRPDFLVERRKDNVIERIIVEVKNECYIHDEHVKQLTEYMKSLAGRNVKILMGILVVPAGAEFSSNARRRIIKHDISIVRLRVCSCK